MQISGGMYGFIIVKIPDAVSEPFTYMIMTIPFFLKIGTSVVLAKKP